MGEKQTPCGGITGFMKVFFIRAASHRYLSLIFRLYIAGLFITADMYKITYSAELAETIASHQMAPYWGVNLMAVVLPWIELICGVALILGIRARAAAFIIAGLMLMFTIGIAINLLWDSPISCGCFSTLGDAISWKTLMRDIIWLAMTAHIFFFDKAFHLENRYAFRLKEI